ncbi:prepilin peptidase [Roseomonas sp. PWR1]|uniref:Prepilin peptidase n=1 Tax=Roseomonas nitratireducens TaxID=2820810 RepID=A0ABS4AQS1_9PROT|nr:prepilin peptidase [Neoroseomonas nitratireducens]MBP0463198.1 prepilin peptidase [Neoroseomonas nitratireducens]
MVPFPAPTMPDAIALVAFPVLAAAAFRDVAVRRIPNALVAAIALLGVARHAASGLGPLFLSCIAASLVLFAAFMLWRRGVLGGGDVKLLAATALLVPPIAVPHLLLATAIAGGLLAACHLLLRRHAGLPVAMPSGAIGRVLRCEAWRIGRGAPLPYGVAIAAGTFFVLIRTGV